MTQEVNQTPDSVLNGREIFKGTPAVFRSIVEAYKQKPGDNSGRIVIGKDGDGFQKIEITTILRLTVGTPVITSRAAIEEFFNGSTSLFPVEFEKKPVATPPSCVLLATLTPEKNSRLSINLVEKWNEVEQFVRKLLDRLQADDWLESSKLLTPPTKEGQESRKDRGIKLGTSERVNEFHRLVKSGLSHRQAKAQSHCDPSTYYHWCEKVTGEEPIEPYR